MGESVRESKIVSTGDSGAKEPFGDRLLSRARKLGPLCAGVDPSAGLLAAWGLDDDADGLARFCDRCLQAFGDRVAVIKPQVAYFERHGAAGMAVLERFVG